MYLIYRNLDKEKQSNKNMKIGPNILEQDCNPSYLGAENLEDHSTWPGKTKTLMKAQYQ
jgi:hypothetical protein